MGEDEFIELLHATEGKLFRIALAILGNEQDAWDSLQQTAERAWHRRETLQGGGAAFPAWIKKILVNQSLNILRSRRQVTPIDPQEILDLLNLPGKDDLEMGLIWHIVLELGAEHRKVVVLRYLGDLSLKEIAAELGISIGTVKSRLNTANNRLRAKLMETNGKGE